MEQYSFQEVIEQFKRLCDSANQDCSSCGLGNMSCSMKYIVDNSVEFEKRVMSWAAENPELVYPTWAEWLESTGLTKHKTGQFCVHMPNQYSYEVKEVEILNEAAYKPIPADIAEKLWLEPQENI